MLRSAGYFSGVTCPSGSEGCHRPYCPFRHKPSYSDGNSTSSLTYQSIDNTIEKIKTDLRKSTSGGHGKPSVSEEPSSSNDFLRASTNPQLGKSSKNLYDTSSLHHPITDMEYDPVVNYSTSGRSKTKEKYSHRDDKIGRSSHQMTSTSSASMEEDINSEKTTDDESLCDNDLTQEGDSVEDVYIIDEGSDNNSKKEAVIEIFGTNSSCDEKDDCVVVESSCESKADKVDLIDLTKEEVAVNPKTSRKIKTAGKNKQKLKNKVSKRNEKEDSIVPTKDKNANLVKKRKAENDNKSVRPAKAIKTQKTCSKDSMNKKVKADTKMKKMCPKDVDISKINQYIDRDEIKKLEEDLEKGDRYEECLRIFKEDSGPHRSIGNDKKTAESPQVETAQPEDLPSLPTKRRIAHANALSSAGNLKRPSGQRKRLSTPAQMMMKRLDIVEQEEAEKLAAGQSTKRIAHKVSDKMASIRAKDSSNRTNIRQLEKKIQSSPWYPGNTDERTVCGTAAKGAPRVAHQSKDLLAIKNGSVIPPRPRIAIDRHSKVPANIRQKYLSTYIDECLRICGNDYDAAYEMAVAEEEQCKSRSNSKNIYLSLAANGLKKLREMPKRYASKTAVEVTVPAAKRKKLNSFSNTSDAKGTQSHNVLLNVNTKKCKGGFTIEKKKEKPKMSSSELYEKMCRYIMTREQLDANGYPRPCDIPGKAEFKSDPPKKPFNTTDKKICAHCGKEFFLNKNGKFLKVEECTYHWGRAYMTRVGKGWEKRYSCCQEREGVEGCTVGDTHVHADNKLDRYGYVKTLIKSPPPDGNCGIFTLDCEMSYTTTGLELTRVSVLDCNCKLVYDTFVKPSGRVLDYNTRWSGITEDDLRHVKTTLRDVQAAFLTKFSSDTILMGHSLESDLVALRIIHETVIDTSIVFPHKRGPPYKRSLKNIASEKIGLLIQTGASEGHDSAEDAAACMKLMMWKIEEDNKLSKKN